MTATSRLVIEINSEQAKRNVTIITQELHRLNTAGNTTINTTVNVTNSLNQQSRAMAAASNSARNLITMLGGMTVAYKAIHAADEWTGLKNRLILVTDSQEQLNAAMSKTFDIAQKTGSSWENAALVYQRFAQNAKELGLNQERLAAITETVSKAVALSGGSAASANAALTQFGQALASGVLRGEEFNSVMEQAPGLAQALAKGLDVPVGKLRGLAMEGKITAAAMVTALEKVAPEVAKSFDKTAFTIGQNLTKLQNAFTKFIGENNGGSASALADGLGKVAENLDFIANTGAAVAIGYFTKAIAASTVAGYGKVQQLIAERGATIAALQATTQATAAELAHASAIVQLTRWQLADAQATMARLTGMQRLAYLQATVMPLEQKLAATIATETAARTANTAAMNAEAAATSRLAVAKRALMGLVGGPAGLIGLVAMVTAGFFLMRDSSNVATNALNEQGLSVEDLTKKYRELNAEQKQLKVIELGDDLKDLRGKVDGVVVGFGLYIENLRQAGTSASRLKGLDTYFDAIKKGGAGAVNALETLKKTEGITPKDIEKASSYGASFKTLSTQVSDTRNTLDFLNGKTKELIVSTNTAVKSNNDHANAINGVGNAANKASEALRKYLSQQNSTVYENAYATKRMQLGDTPDLASELAKRAQLKKSDTGVGALTKTEIDDAKEFIKQQTLRNSLQQEYTDSIKATEKSTKDSQKTEDKAADKRRKDYEDLVAQYRTESEAIDDLYKKQGILATSYGTLAEKKALIAKIDAAGAYEQAQARIRKEQEYVSFFEAYNDQAAIIYQRYEWEKELAAKNTKFTEKEQKNIFNALVESQAREVALINNKNAQEILSTKQSYLSQADFMTERYRLEREEIEKTIGKSKELKDALIAASKLKEFEERQAIKNAASSLYQDKNVTQMQRNDPNGYAKWNMQNEYDTNSGAMDTAFANQKSAIVSDPLVSEADKNAQLLEAEKQYLDAKEAMNTEYNKRQKEMLIAQASVALSSTESMFSSLTDIAATTAGKQSKAYKAMFTIQKIASIAQSSLAISTGIAQAAALPFPANIGAMASVAAATAGIISDIQGIHMEGFANGGYTGAGGKYETAGLVHKGEVVWSQEDIKRSGGVSNVEAMRKGSSSNQPIVNVNVIQGQGVKVTTTDDGQGNITVEAVRQEIANMLPNLVAGELGNQNSRTSKALKQNFNVAPKR